MWQKMKRGSTNPITISDQKCEFCGSCQLACRQKTEQFEYGFGDHRVTLSAFVPVLHCLNCDEQYTDQRAEQIRNDAVCLHLGRLTPNDLKEMRNKLGYSQEKWAQLTGIGVASIKRWESGNQIQGTASDRYLRLLKVPGVLDELRILVERRVRPEEIMFRSKFPEDIIRRSKIFRLQVAAQAA